MKKRFLPLALWAFLIGIPFAVAYTPIGVTSPITQSATTGAIGCPSCLTSVPATSLINLGTATSATNPSRSGTTNTGFYSDTSGDLQAAISGTNEMIISASGISSGQVCASDTCMATAFSHGFISGNGFRLGEVNGGATNYVTNNFGIGLSSPTATLDVGNSSGDALKVVPTASEVDYIQITGDVTATHSPSISAAGTDTNVSIILTPKGTGGVAIGTTTSSGELNVAGAINTTTQYNVGGSQIAIGNLANIAGGTIVGNNTGSAAAPAASIAPVLGIGGTSTGTIGLANSGNASATTIISPSTSTSTGWTITLPTSGGTSGYVLSTNGSGVTSWVAQSGGGGSVNFGTATSATNPSRSGTTNTGFYSDTSGEIEAAVGGTNYFYIDNGGIHAPAIQVVSGGTGDISWGSETAWLAGSGSSSSADFVSLNADSNLVLKAINPNTAVNYFTMSGAATTGAPSIAASGSDTNINIALTPKGTGVVTNGGVIEAPPITNYIQNPGNDYLPKWKTAFAKVKANTGNAHILWIGTSTVGGFCTSPTGTQWSQPATLEAQQAAYLQSAYGLPANNDNIFGYPSADGTGRTSDSRMVVNAGWGADTVYSIGGPMFVNTTTTNAVVFTAPTTADTAILYYATDNSGSPTLGTISWKVNAGTATNINEGASAPAVAKQTITLTPGANTVSIARVSGTTKFIGIEFYLSTKATVNVINSGVGGVVAGTWIDASGKAYATPAAFSAVSPDLSYILMDNNDAIANTNITTYKSNMQSIYNNLTNGDTVWISQVPYGPNAGTVANIPAFITALGALATTNSNPFVNLYARIPTYTLLSTAAQACGDDLHGNFLAYQDQAHFDTDQTMLIAGQSIPPATQLSSTYSGPGASGIISMPDPTSLAVGYGALYTVTPNSDNTAGNTAFGINALELNTTATHNTAIGYNTLAVNTTGASSTAVGYTALAAQTTGTQNDAFGSAALGSLTTGVQNVSVGRLSCSDIVGGSNNVCFGPGVGSSILVGGSDNILIGVSTACDASGASASNELHICGTAGDSIKTTGMGTLSTEATTLRGTLTLTDIASDATHTDATVCEDTTTHTLYRGSGTGDICLGTSSLRYKRDVSDLTDGLVQIEALHPVNYFYKDGYGDDGARQQYGFLAEDVVGVLPKLVGLDAQGKPNTVDLLGMTPILVRAIQQQQQEIEELERRNIVAADPCKAFNVFGRWVMGCPR